MRAPSPPRSPVAAALLAVLTGLLLAAGGALAYVRTEIGSDRAFSGRLVSALDDPAVRGLVADRSVDALLDRGPGDLLAVRPLLSTVVEAVVAGAPFRRLATIGVADAHRGLVARRGSVALTVERTGQLLLTAVRSVSPAVAARTPAEVRPLLTRVNPDNPVLRGVRDAVDLARWSGAFLAGALVAALAALVLAPDRRRAVGHLGAAMAGAGAVVAGVVQIGQTVAVSHVSRVTDLDAGRDRDALGATWNALFGDLRTAALVVAVGGIAVAAVAAGVTQPSGLARRARRAATAVARPTPVRRGLLVAAGLVCLAAPAVALRGLVLALGAASLLFGLEGIAGRLTARSARSRPARRDGVLAAVAVVIVVGALAAAGAAALDAPAVPRAAPATAAGCNGSVANCDRRINDVVWPATHNSYAASDQAGWYFANQTRGIGRQLDDGIRGFLIDVHDGVRDARTGRVRTDVHAEGTTRNKVAEQLSPQALRLADRLAGRVGAGELRGRREPYLCHTLCEIGAEPLDDELTVIRRFLEGHPRQVLMVVVEPYVGPGVVEAALRRTRLLPYLAELDREEPRPTLGDLIAAGKRLVVFSEADGGARPWYMPAFSFMQDTPLGARRPADLRCARYRGTADSPILLMNHWIDRFPPRASQNARIGRSPFLRDRIDRCAAARGQRPAVIAVDFYERTSVVAVARDLTAETAVQTRIAGSGTR